MKKKKSKKKLVIGVGILAVGACCLKAYSGMGQSEQSIPQVEVIEATRGNVQQTVETSGTVVSEEEKTYFSPVNAKVDSVSLKEGDTVKAGTKLVEFDQKDLEREEKKADLNVESGKLDMQNSINKSDQAVQKQKNAQGNAVTLKQQVAAQQSYIAGLKSQIAQANASAQAKAASDAAKKEKEAKTAQEAQDKASEQEYNAAVAAYQNTTLPDYQNRLNQLNTEANEAQQEYNEAENTYQMAFQTWSADASEENADELTSAEQLRSDAQIAYQTAKTAYEDYKAQKPEPPVRSDYTGTTDDFVSDGTRVSASEQTTRDTSTTVTADTTALENQLEQASNDLAELQSKLSSEEAAAEADPGALTKEEKEKMEITNNLSELDQMSAKELVQAAKKGISADFNGVISKVSVVEGSTTALGTELFTLQNTDNVDVNVNISKYDYDKVKEGQKAEITLAGKTYEGEVKSVSHIATQNEKGASLISADVKILNPDEEIFIGVDAKVTIQAEQARDVLVIPAEVVNIGKEGSFCYVLENDVIIRKDITTGISSDDYVEVMDGLAEGDEVIRDLGDLEEGMTAEASTGQDDVEASAGASESTDSESAEEGA